jgi:hypothetical protein
MSVVESTARSPVQAWIVLSVTGGVYIGSLHARGLAWEYSRSVQERLWGARRVDRGDPYLNQPL